MSMFRATAAMMATLHRTDQQRRRRGHQFQRAGKGLQEHHQNQPRLWRTQTRHAFNNWRVPGAVIPAGDP